MAKMIIRYTTVAMEEKQYLITIFQANIVETYCKGYKRDINGKDYRDRSIDGYYYTKEISLKQPKIGDIDDEYEQENTYPNNKQ